MIEAGSLTWMNWQAQRAGGSTQDGYEFNLFSDSLVTGLGQLESYGPYRFINALSGINEGQMKPGIVLEVDLYNGSFPEMEPPPLRPATGSKRWIGLSIDEELAALLSTLLGIRLRSSGFTRKWDSDFPRGRPWLFEYREPLLPDGAQDNRARMFPDLPRKDVQAEPALQRLASFADLDAKTSVSLMRAAKEYSNALWIAEMEPELAWLQLVSAIEVAADIWNGAVSDPTSDLQLDFPALAERLEAASHDLALEAANALAGLTGSTRKFTSFVERFAPGAPTRESEWPGLDWTDKEEIVSRARMIYRHRSKRLHNAIPFPSPLIRPTPLRFGPTEIPMGEGSASAFSSWDKSSLPFTLWAFAHLTRGALLNWWDSLT